MSFDLKKVAQSNGCWPTNVRSFINRCASETHAIHTSLGGVIVWEISVDAKHAQWNSAHSHQCTTKKWKGEAPTHAQPCAPRLSLSFQRSLFMVCLRSLLFCVWECGEVRLFCLWFALVCFARAFLWMDPPPPRTTSSPPSVHPHKATTNLRAAVHTPHA